MKPIHFEESYSKIVSRETLMIILGSLLLFTVFFPIRYVFYTNLSYFTGAYSDFTSFSLYLSDVIIVIFFFFNWKKFYDHNILYFFAILGSWMVVSIFRSTGNTVIDSTSLEIYFLAKFYELFVVFLFFSDIKHLRKGGIIILWSFLGLLASQIVLGLYQFFAQKSLGLHWLGESPLGLLTAGVAKVVSHETTIMRIYGSMPHPNILSALFMVGIVLICWQILVVNSKKYQYLLYILLYGSITTLVLTFSRAGWLGTGVALSSFGLFYFVKNGLNKRALVLGIGILVFTGVNIAMFHEFLASRTTISDAAIVERVFYNNLAVQMIKDNPISGLGVGSSVLHMEHYAGIEMRPWEIQPIHNYYLLTAAELGLVGFVMLIGFFIYLAVRLGVKTANTVEPAIYMRRIFLGSVLLAIFVMMLFDHYFYTIQSMQILFWAILGLIFAELKRDDQAYL